jgi:hypothetical protein
MNQESACKSLCSRFVDAGILGCRPLSKDIRGLLIRWEIGLDGKLRQRDVHRGPQDSARGKERERCSRVVVQGSMRPEGRNPSQPSRSAWRSFKQIKITHIETWIFFCEFGVKVMSHVFLLLFH